MPAATTTLASSLLNQVLRAAPYTPPGNVYLALFTVAPTASGGGTEVVGGSYARAPLTFNTSTDGTTSNANLVQITGMPAVTVVGLGVMSATTGTVASTMLFYGTLLTPKTTNSGDTFTCQVSSLNIALS